MKKLFLSAISVVMATCAYAVPNSFSDGDIVSAEKMNENFQHLEQQFQGTQQALAKTVNCAAGEKIGDAISNGYTNITVSGTCTENLNFFEEWGDNTFALAPRYLKLTGADSTAKIVDATGGSEITIFVGAGTTLSIENLTISGGSWGLGAYRNSNLLLSKVTIEGFTQRGISVGDSSYLGVNDGGVTISGSSGAEFGIYMVTGSSGWVRTATISGTKTGVNLYGGSFLYLYDFAIDAIERGISIHDQSTVLKVNAGVGVIEGTSDRAISVGRASFYSWDPGSLTIQNLNGGRGIDYEQSDGIINNLKMTDFNNTGSGWNPPIRLGNASALVLNNSEVSGETDSNLINVDRSSMLEVNNSNISGTAGDALISAGRQSLLDIENSTISGTAGALIGIDRGSTLQVENQTTLSGTVQDVLVGINHGSGAEISNSTLTLQSGPIGLNVQSSANLKLQNSSLSGPATDSLVNVARLSNAIISNGSTLSQEDTDAPDVAVRNVSFLSVWDSNTSINKVDCNSTGHVSYDEGTVTTVNCD